MLAGSPGTGSYYYYYYKFSNLGWNLVVLDGLVAVGVPPRQSRPFLVFYKYLPRYCALYVLCAALQKYQPVQIKCDLAQQAMTRTETWPKGHQEHHTRGILVLCRISLRYPGYSATLGLELHTCHSAPCPELAADSEAMPLSSIGPHTNMEHPISGTHGRSLQ